ncbi:hypothetical protein JG687_00008204, partial [Phytophthora cactorum]
LNSVIASVLLFCTSKNYFTRVEDMRDFVIVHAPSPGVEITVKMGISKDLFELNVINRKRFIVQITVWDAKKRVGEQVDGRRRVDRVVQKAVPVLKHKGERTPSDRKGKARALAVFDAEEEKGEEPNADAAVAALRTRDGEDVNVCWC